MRPSVVLPLVLVAVAALLAVLFLGGKDTDPGPGPVTPEAEQVQEPRRGPGEANLVSDDRATTAGGADAATAGRRSVDEGVVQAEEDSPDRTSRIQVTVRNQDGEPVADARLTLVVRPPGAELTPFLTQAAGADAALDLGGEREFEGRSRADGTFLFQDLKPSPYYSLVVRHADYAQREIRNVAVRGGKTATVSVTLEEGLMVHGYVRDEGGRAVEGARLVLTPIATLNMPPATQIEMGATTTSNADGYYAFRNVDILRTNTLIAHKQGYGRTARTDLRQEGQDTSIEVDFRLQPGLSIRGRVVGPAGQAIEGAIVDAYGFVAIQNARGNAVTKADGTFELLDLVDGPYQIRARAEGWAEVREPRVDAGEQNLTLELQPLGEVTGRVVENATNRPVTEFSLSVRRVTPGSEIMSPPFMRRAFKNAADGAFTMKGVPEGVYVLEGEAAGFAPTQSNSFEVRLGQVVSGVEVRLSTGGSIRGRVSDAVTGEPIRGATVATQDNGFMDNPLTQIFGAAMSRRTTARTAVTDDEGVFELTQLKPDVYQLRIEHPDYTASIVRDLRIDESTEALDYGEFPLQKGGSIAGFVYDENGAPLEGATVSLSNMDTPGLTYQGRTDANGQYSLEHLAPGRYQVHAQRQMQAGGNPFEALLDVQRSQREVYVDNGVELAFDLSLAE